MLGWVPKSELNNAATGFLNFVKNLEVDPLLTSISRTIPAGWHFTNETISYIQRFLESNQRLESIETQAIEYITHFLEDKP